MTMNAHAQPSVVQFLHPGPERLPKPLQIGAELAWNTGTHGRKFLLSPGTWTDAEGTTHQGELTFWGEWEPQSQVVEVLTATEPGQPRALQHPWFSITDTGWRQNTDPLVFGDAFAYTNCRQNQNSKLRQLAPGSVVLFGSKLGGGFVLDTVLVVADSSGYRAVDGPPVGLAVAAQELVTDPLSFDPKTSGATNTWYRGATFDTRAAEMFSFVPARPHEPGRPGFARPRIDLDGLVNPNLAMAAKSTALSLEAAQAVWDRVIEQVFDAGLVLATHLRTPTRVAANGALSGGREAGRC